MHFGVLAQCGFRRCSVQALVAVCDGSVLGDVSGAGAGAALVLLGLLVSGVGDGAGARAGAVWGIVAVASS